PYVPWLVPSRSGEPSPQSVDENLKPVLEALIGRAERPGGRAQQRKGAGAGWRVSGTGSGTGRIGVAGGGGGTAVFGLDVQHVPEHVGVQGEQGQQPVGGGEARVGQGPQLPLD